MSKKITSKTHVFSSAFDTACLAFGPGQEGNKNVAKVLCRDVRTIRDWRSGLKPCPKWAFELVRLTYEDRFRQMEHMKGKYRGSKLFGHATRLSPAIGAVYGAESANDSFSVLDLPLSDGPNAAMP